MSRATYVLLLAALTACSRSESAANGSPAVQATPVAAAAEPPKPVVEDTTFRLVLTGEPSYTAGSDAKLALTLEARGGYHVNQEYPIRVELKAPSEVKLGKASLVRADATQFDEQVAKFELPFSASGGTHELQATVDFAVCTKETCVPDTRTLALAVQVR